MGHRRERGLCRGHRGRYRSRSWSRRSSGCRSWCRSWGGSTSGYQADVGVRRSGGELLTRTCGLGRSGCSCGHARHLLVQATSHGPAFACEQTLTSLVGGHGHGLHPVALGQAHVVVAGPMELGGAVGQATEGCTTESTLEACADGGLPRVSVGSTGHTACDGACGQPGGEGLGEAHQLLGVHPMLKHGPAGVGEAAEGRASSLRGRGQRLDVTLGEFFSQALEDARQLGGGLHGRSLRGQGLQGGQLGGVGR